MSVAWFFVPYRVTQNPQNGRLRRSPAVKEFAARIRAEGGAYKWVECFGNHAIARVRASDALLDEINAAPGVVRVPARFLDLSQQLGDLSNAERNTLNTFLVNRLGFTQPEINAAVGSTNGQWRQRTLRQVLNFCRSRWRRPIPDGAGGVTFEADDWPGGAPGDLEGLPVKVAG